MEGLNPHSWMHVTRFGFRNAVELVTDLSFIRFTPHLIALDITGCERITTLTYVRYTTQLKHLGLVKPEAEWDFFHNIVYETLEKHLDYCSDLELTIPPETLTRLHKPLQYHIDRDPEGTWQCKSEHPI